MINTTKFQLYEKFGDRYDLHTPSHHYKHDHEFVLKSIHDTCSINSRVLDIGCGTGVFLEKALFAGLDPIGIDPAAPMLKLAEKRVGSGRVRLGRMQDFKIDNSYDSIVFLSWSINYCSDKVELHQVLKNCLKAMNPKGLLLLQVAHAPNAATQPPSFMIDHESGPGGAKDIVLQYRFWASGPQTMEAEYSFQCISTHETFNEVHSLNVADANFIAQTAIEVGFTNVQIIEDYLGASFKNSVSPFILAHCP